MRGDINQFEIYRYLLILSIYINKSENSGHGQQACTMSQASVDSSGKAYIKEINTIHYTSFILSIRFEGLLVNLQYKKQVSKNFRMFLVCIMCQKEI